MCLLQASPLAIHVDAAMPVAAAGGASGDRSCVRRRADGGAETAGALRAVSDGDAKQGSEAEEEPTGEELLREAGHAFGEIFAVRAPRDVMGGLWSGLQCIVSGLFMGMAGVVMQPVEGLRDGGVVGCLRGIAFGLCTGLFFSLTGICTGLFQVIRGVVVTPRALCMSSKGWQWDRQEARWAEPRAYSLLAEAEEVLGDGAADDEEDDADDAGATSSVVGRRVAETFYYDLLRVAPGASQREIRKAYFQQSRQWHPDKTSEADAKERFQVISEAYQVLSDPTRRQAYDSQGRDGVGEGFVDAQVFFSVLLGANQLAPYVGRLRIAEMFGDDLFSGIVEDLEADDFSKQFRQDERSQRRQVRRQVQLAVGLAERLDAYKRESRNSFCESARTEARSIVQKDASLGRFVAEIGWVYRNRAELFLARKKSRFGAYGARALLLEFQSKGRKVGQQANTAKLAVSSFLKLRTIAKEADSTTKRGEDSSGAEGGDGVEDDTEGLPESWNQALPVFMDTFWSLSAHDIVGTLTRVVDRVLDDASVRDEDRQQRAEGLRDFGIAFEDVAAATAEAARSGIGGLAGGATSPAADNEKRKRFEAALAAAAGGGAGGSPTAGE